jgi:serine/threonine-protein kinase
MTSSTETAALPPRESTAGVPPGTMIASRYRVVKPLTDGGMATVYIAEDTLALGALRALKIMAPRLLRDERLRERFAQEAMIGTTLKHPHIVAVLGTGVDPALESPWIAMELLRGGTIADVLKQRGPLPPQEVRQLFLDFGAAMAAAHTLGVVHRDLKPENVFLESSPTDTLPFTVKVLDFGIAKVRKETAMKNSQLIGSPLWMAPEQLSAGTAIDSFTDVWPFGLLAFYALTGKPYWVTANEPSMNLPRLLAEIMAADIVTPTERARAIGARVTWPPAFDEWFLQCVSRDANRRFRAVGEAADALDGAFTGRAPSIPPIPLTRVRTPTPPEPVRAVDPQSIEPIAPTRVPAAPKPNHPEASIDLPMKSRAPVTITLALLLLVAIAVVVWMNMQ